MQRFLNFRKRARVYVDTATEVVSLAAIMYASKKMEYTDFDGPSTADAVESIMQDILPPTIQVFVKVAGITKTALISDHMFPIYQMVHELFVRSDFFLTWNGKPLTVLSNPIELGITHGATIVCTMRLRGGSTCEVDRMVAIEQPSTHRVNPLFCTQSMSVEIENLIIRAQHTDLEWLDLPISLEEIHQLVGLSHQDIVARVRAFEMSDLQDGDEESANSWRIMTHHIHKAMRSMPGISIPGYDGGFNEIMEGLMILKHWHRTCTSKFDYYTLARTAYMCFTGKSLTTKLMMWLLPSPELQGFEDIVGAMRTAMDLGKTVTESELIKKLRKAYTYLLVQGVLQKMGLEVSENEFTYLARRPTPLNMAPS
jgi:hypothetical protein